MDVQQGHRNQPKGRCVGNMRVYFSTTDQIVLKRLELGEVDSGTMLDYDYIYALEKRGN